MFSDDISPMFPAQILSVRSSFRAAIAKMTCVRELSTLLIVENGLLATTYPDVCTACIMYLTVPVTVAAAERSFSKLRLIKNYLRSSMGQHRLSSLGILSIEHERARKIDFSTVIEKFAALKVRRKRF